MPDDNLMPESTAQARLRVFSERRDALHRDLGQRVLFWARIHGIECVHPEDIREEIRRVRDLTGESSHEVPPEDQTAVLAEVERQLLMVDRAYDQHIFHKKEEVLPLDDPSEDAEKIRVVRLGGRDGRLGTNDIDEAISGEDEEDYWPPF